MLLLSTEQEMCRDRQGVAERNRCGDGHRQRRGTHHVPRTAIGVSESLRHFLATAAPRASLLARADDPEGYDENEEGQPGKGKGEDTPLRVA